MTQHPPFSPGLIVRRSALLALALGVPTLGLAQSNGAQQFRATYTIHTVTNQDAATGALTSLERQEGTVPDTSTFMPGAKVVNYLYVMPDPATGTVTLSGYKVFIKGADSVIDQFSGTFNPATMRGEGKTTFLSGTGAFAGIKGEGKFSYTFVQNSPVTIAWDGTYTVNPKRN